ncbi:MAG TPA: DUF5317 domain-containing protein [Actinomycetota bacterium]
MLLILAVIVAGLLVGIALGGDVRTLSEIKLRWWPLALVGLGLQLIPVPSMSGQIDHWLAVGLLVASYVVLLVFVAMNIRLAGFPMIAAGFALNLFVISLNGGMPVTQNALRQAYGSSYAAEIARLQEHGGAKHHLARDDDVLVSVADVIPVGGPLHQVLSVGDIVFMAGVFWVIAAATRGATGRHRPGATRGSPDARDLAAPAVDPAR